MKRPFSWVKRAMIEFETIVDDFSFIDEWEERYKYIIDLGHQLAPLTEEEHAEENKVRGCASQVWLVFDAQEDDRLVFRGDSDAHIVKGLVALMVSLFSGKTKAEILAIDAKAALAQLDLDDHITPQRSNGVAYMIEKIRKTASA